MPQLRVLKIGGESARTPLRELLAGDLLGQLEELTLQFPGMSMEDVALLGSSIERFTHLAKLELDDNRLSPSMCQRLRAQLPKLVGCSDLPPRIADHLSPRSRWARANT